MYVWLIYAACCSVVKPHDLPEAPVFVCIYGCAYCVIWEEVVCVMLKKKEKSS